MRLRGIFDPAEVRRRRNSLDYFEKEQRGQGPQNYAANFGDGTLAQRGISGNTSGIVIIAITQQMMSIGMPMRRKSVNR